MFRLLFISGTKGRTVSGDITTSAPDVKECMEFRQKT